MKRKNVTSSNIKTLGFDSKNKVLEVEFHSSGIYYYKNVPIDLYNRLSRAPSIGKGFNSLIKNKFPHVKGEWLEPVLEVDTLDKPVNIYLAGGAGAGKTYSAKYLIEKYGYVQGKIAGPIYYLAQNYFGMKEK